MAIRRPDLDIEPVKLPDYIGPRIFPWLGKQQNAGNLYYRDYAADISAQAARDTAAAATINATTVAAAHTAFAVSELRARERMSYDQVIGYKDKATAELAMARAVKRAWYNAAELADSAAVLVPGAGVTPVDASISCATVIETQATLLRDKGQGKVALVVSNHNYVLLKRDPSVKERMRNTGVILGAGGDPRAITQAQMAIVFGVDEVLVGPDSAWYTGVAATSRGNAALVMLPEGTMDPTEEVQFGRHIFFEWDQDAKHFVVESFHEDGSDTENVDAKGQTDLIVLNPELLTILALPDFTAYAAIGDDGQVLALDADGAEIWIDPLDYAKPATSTTANKQLKVGATGALTWVDAAGQSAYAPADQVLTVSDGAIVFADKDTLTWKDSVGTVGQVQILDNDGVTLSWEDPADWDDPTTGAAAGKILKKPATGTQLTWATGPGAYQYAPSAYALVSDGTVATFTAISTLTWKA